MPLESADDARRLAETKRAHDIRGMFDAISPTYDLLNHLLSLNIDRCWRWICAQRLISKDICRVLDLCSGTGDLALAFARRAKRVGIAPLIVSADFSKPMVRLADRKFRRARLQSCNLLPTVADALHLPFTDSQFDLVSAAFGIRNVVDAPAALREMARVCRNGATVAVLEFSRPRNGLLKACYGLYFSSVLPAIGRLVSGSPAYTYLPQSVARFPEGREFVNLLAQAARGEVTSIRLTCGIATLYIAKVRKEE